MTTELFHIESEQSIVGGLLLDPNAYERIDWLNESDFYREDYRLIYRHIVAMLAAGKPVDVITVAESLASSGVDQGYIGLAHLGQLAANTPSAANIQRYAEIVSDKRKRRELLHVSAQIADLARDTSSAAISSIDEAEALIFNIAANAGEDRSDEPEALSGIMSQVIEDIEDRFSRGGAISGLATGYSDLDEKTCGLNGGDLVIVAGRPAMGKTAFALNIAENVALQGKTALIFSLEMGKKQLVERCLASIGQINLNSIRSGKLTDDDFGRMSVALGKLSQAGLIIDDKPALKVSQMRSRARRVARRQALSLIVVDYIQLATGDGDNREQEVSSISRGLKAIAKEFNVPVIALSQLSRKCEERTNKRPMLSDLRESGAIEQDADLILMMYRDEYYNPESHDKWIAEIIIGKQRQGETGTVNTVFRGEHSRFYAMSQEAKRDLYARREAEKPMRHSRGFK